MNASRLKKLLAFMLVLSLLGSVFACSNDTYKRVKRHRDSSRFHSYTKTTEESRESTNTPNPSLTINPEATPVPYNGEYGSAGSLPGKTVVISIFINDSEYSWEGTTKAKQEDLAEQLTYACSWLSLQAASYGESAEFFCDWREYPDLRIDVSTDDSLVVETSEHYFDQCEIINSNIDENAYLEEYGAEDIIYIFFINTPRSNEIRSWTLNYQEGYDLFLEYINIFTGSDGCYLRPSDIAHEMLHCFGAPDFYYANEIVPQEIVDYYEEINSEDIMFRAYDIYEITLEFSDIDAYYVGLIDYCDEIDEWNLGPADWDT